MGGGARDIFGVHNTYFLLHLVCSDIFASNFSTLFFLGGGGHETFLACIIHIICFIWFAVTFLPATSPHYFFSLKYILLYIENKTSLYPL